MLDSAMAMFHPDGFMPHGYCILWTPSLLWLYIVSDTVIALSYYSIPLALVYFVRKRADLQFNWIFLMFSLFIFACGTTHLLSIWTFWHPDYWLDASMKAVTAAASIMTAIVLWPLIPRALKLPSAKQLSDVIAQLEREVEERKCAEAKLAKLNQFLEQRVEERTLDLELQIRDRQYAENQVRLLNSELQDRVMEKEAILENALVGIALLRDRIIVTCNRRFEEIFGYAAGEASGHSTRMLYHTEEDFNAIGEQAYGALESGVSYTGTFMMVKRDGTLFWGEISGRALDSTHPQAGSIWIYNDVTERKRAEERIQFLAYHDILTQLPNPLLLQDRFQQATAFADRVKAKVALLFLDLDNFKTINDSLGHAIGDGLIKQVASRLSEYVRETDTICRQGGDEFIIMLASISDADATAPVLAKLTTRLLDPFDIDGHELTTSASVGIAMYPDDGIDFATLMKKADLAMYRAKDAGRNTYRFFDEQMHVEAVEQLRMRNGLRRALEHGEFVLHYQPQIDFAGGAIIGAEALIRWNHPEFGMVPPARFIPIAEDSGLIVLIGEWVLREACRQAAAWHAAGMRGLQVAVNLSAVQFKRGDLEQSIVAALEESGIDPGMLELELTESILISNTESILATVKRLKALGVKLSIDDFGTGYSSLSYLKRFEVDKLKIDQSFVRNLATDTEDAAIVRAIIQMARSLGLRTLAEGVEDKHILEQLRAFGCDEAQGYYFARPMPAADFSIHYERWLTENGPIPSELK